MAALKANHCFEKQQLRTDNRNGTLLQIRAFPHYSPTGEFCAELQLSSFQFPLQGHRDQSPVLFPANCHNNSSSNNPPK